jgi:hypothetical protein
MGRSSPGTGELRPIFSSVPLCLASVVLVECVQEDVTNDVNISVCGVLLIGEMADGRRDGST